MGFRLTVAIGIPRYASGFQREALRVSAVGLLPLWTIRNIITAKLLSSPFEDISCQSGPHFTNVHFLCATA
jgi:hypothetical protein